MATICVSGARSGIGAAVMSRLEAHGHRAIGIDLADTEIIADLGSPAGRQSAVSSAIAASGGDLNGLAAIAGIGGFGDRSGAEVVAVNYFGTTRLLEGLRPLLAENGNAAALAMSSATVTCQPGIPLDLIEACLADDEAAACSIGEKVGPASAYPATKVAIARYVRRSAPQPDWIGLGITLNAVAPGLIDTPMVAESRADPAAVLRMQRFAIPAGRAGKPEEVAALVGFLLGPEARFVRRGRLVRWRVRRRDARRRLAGTVELGTQAEKSRGHPIAAGNGN